MNLLRNLQKNLKAHHLVVLVGVLVLGYAVYQYSARKASVLDSMDNAEHKAPAQAEGAVAEPAKPAGKNADFASAEGLGEAKGLAPTGAAGPKEDPAHLLPADENSQWARLNPSGNMDMKNVNMLKAGYHHGINTVGSSLRNANLQVRSEPPNPTNKVSPWMNTTIEPDLMRVPLELGCKC